MRAEVPPRLRRVCTDHGPVAGSPCPECGDEVYDLANADDRAFVKQYVGQRRFQRQLKAGLIAMAIAMVALFAIGEIAFYPAYILVFVVFDMLLYGLQPAERLEVEVEVTSPPRGRGLSSAPVLVLVALVVLFPMTTELRAPTMFADKVLMVSDAALERWALLPSELLAGHDLHTLITHAGLHADAAHLIGNVIALLVFGLALDLRVGRLACAGVLVFGAAAGGFAQAVLGSSSAVYVIGASGAVYALAGASLVTMPDRKWHLNLGDSPVPIPAWALIPLWMALLFAVDVLLHENVAVWAHAGGLVVGGLLGVLLRLIPEPREFRDAEAEIAESVGELED